MKSTRWMTFVFVSFAVFALPVQAQTLLRVATPEALTGASPIYVSAKTGNFNQYGLTVDVIATRNEQMNSQALMSDSVPVSRFQRDGTFLPGATGA